MQERRSPATRVDRSAPRPQRGAPQDTGTGNAAMQDRVRQQVPYRPQMESAFGEDFGGLDVELGAGGMGSMLALASQERVAFAAGGRGMEINAAPSQAVHFKGPESPKTEASPVLTFRVSTKGDQTDRKLWKDLGEWDHASLRLKRSQAKAHRRRIGKTEGDDRAAHAQQAMQYWRDAAALQGSIVEPGLDLYAAMKGLGTDDAAVKKVLSTLKARDNKTNLKVFDGFFWACQRYGQLDFSKSGRELLEEWIKGDFDGREEQEMLWLLTGKPQTAQDKVADARRRYDYERKGNSSLGQGLVLAAESLGRDDVDRRIEVDARMKSLEKLVDSW